MNILRLRKAILASFIGIFAVTLVGCGGKNGDLNPEIVGINGPTVELIDGRFIMSMTFENLKFDGGITLPIPKYPNSSLAIGPDFESDGMLLVFTVAIEDFVSVGGNGLNPQKLPGGRPLPGVASGQFPAIALKVPQVFDTIFYVGPKMMGLFVPFEKLNLNGGILSFRFHDKDGVKVGTVSLVGQDIEKKNAGILVMINIDDRIQTSINNFMAAL